MREETGRCILTIGLIISIIFSAFYLTSITVYSADRGDTKTKEYYAQIEKEYRREIKTTLENEGLKNSGVTMTKIFDGEEKREYSVVIHNEKWERMDEESKTVLMNNLNKINLQIEGARVEFIFNENLTS